MTKRKLHLHIFKIHLKLRRKLPHFVQFWKVPSQARFIELTLGALLVLSSILNSLFAKLLKRLARTSLFGGPIA